MLAFYKLLIGSEL